MIDWRKHVVEVDSKEELLRLIASGEQLQSGVAKLTGLTGRFNTVVSLAESTAAFRAQLAEKFPDTSTESIK